MMQIVIATGNAGKIKEIEILMADLPIRLRSLNEFPKISEPEETGATFAENAALKARYYSLETGIWALADDSGLAVEALDGAPGVFSARYAGADADDKQKIEKLLGELENAENRRARFVCAMAVADEKGEIKLTAEGICNGLIALKANGNQGFGYDPIFIPEGYSATFGTLTSGIKQQISHRKRAITEIIQQIPRFYDILT